MFKVSPISSDIGTELTVPFGWSLPQTRPCSSQALLQMIYIEYQYMHSCAMLQIIQSVGFRSGQFSSHWSGATNCGAWNDTVSWTQCADVLSCWKSNMSLAVLWMADSSCFDSTLTLISHYGSRCHRLLCLTTQTMQPSLEHLNQQSLAESWTLECRPLPTNA